jgi:hypothetical protein
MLPPALAELRDDLMGRYKRARQGEPRAPQIRELLRELMWSDQIEALDEAIAFAERVGKMKPSTIGFTVDGRCPLCGREGG